MKLFFITSAALLALYSQTTNGFELQCDQKIYGEKLRYGEKYLFSQDIDASNETYEQFIRGLQVHYQGEGDLPWSAGMPSFSRTKWLIDKEHIISPNEKGKIYTANESYKIQLKPPKRGPENLSLQYETTIYKRINKE